jgi:hypothetical protein
MLSDLKELCLQIKEAQKSNRDFVLVLSGFVGEGKSTLSLQLAKEYLQIKNLDEFKDFCETSLFYNRKELLDAVMNTHEKIIIADEAVNMLFRRNFASGEQKLLLQIMDVCRDHKHLFVLNIPSFWSLDSHTVQNRVRMWIYVELQKYAHMFLPIKRPFAKDVWEREKNDRKCPSMSSIPECDNYVKTFTFDALSPDEYEIYQKIKDAKKIVKEAEIEVKRDKTQTKDIVKQLKMKNPNISTTDIAKSTGVSVRQARRILNGI